MEAAATMSAIGAAAVPVVNTPNTGATAGRTTSRPTGTQRDTAFSQALQEILSWGATAGTQEAMSVTTDATRSSDASRGPSSTKEEAGKKEKVSVQETDATNPLGANLMAVQMVVLPVQTLGAAATQEAAVTATTSSDAPAVLVAATPQNATPLQTQIPDPNLAVVNLKQATADGFAKLMVDSAMTGIQRNAAGAGTAGDVPVQQQSSDAVVQVEVTRSNAGTAASSSGVPLGKIVQMISDLQNADTKSQGFTPISGIDVTPPQNRQAAIQLTHSSVPEAEKSLQLPIPLMTQPAATKDAVQTVHEPLVPAAGHANGPRVDVGSKQQTGTGNPGNGGSDDSVESKTQSGLPSSDAKNGATNFAEMTAAATNTKNDAAQSAASASTIVVVAATSQSTTNATNLNHSLDNKPAASEAPAADSAFSRVPETANDKAVMSSAQIAESAGRSEMRISMETDKLGPIELHARVTGDEVGAAILVEKRDAHAALAVELPALQQALSDKQLRVQEVALLQGSLSSAKDGNGNTSQHQQPDAPRSVTGGWGTIANGPAINIAMQETSGIFDATGRLSVRA